jgi:hypothetical protein
MGMLHNEIMTIIAGIAIHDNEGMRSTKEDVVYSVLFLFTSSHGMHPEAVALIKLYLMPHGARSRSMKTRCQKTEKRTDELLL